MSDFENKDQQNPNPESEQMTRIVPTVDETEPTTTARRRRAETPSEQPSTVASPSEVTDATSAVPARRPLRADVQKAADQTNAARRAPRPQALNRAQSGGPGSQGVPRPEALKRADQSRQTAGSESEGKQPLRRPVSAPGYSQKPPVSKPRVSRPVRPEMLDETERVAESVETNRRHTGLIAAVIAVLLVAVLLLGVLMIPENATGVLGKVRTTVAGLFNRGQNDPAQTAAKQPEALDFSAAPTQVTVGQMISFTLTTTKNASGVRLVDEEGSVLPTMTSMFENADSMIWIMNLNTTEAYDGAVHVQIANGDEWVDTEMSMGILVEAQNTPAADPTEAVITAVPETEAPTMETEAPTAEPDEVPAAAIDDRPDETEPVVETETPAPTAVVEVTPTLAPSATPTVPGETVVTQAPVMIVVATDMPDEIEPEALDGDEIPDEIVDEPQVGEIAETGDEVPDETVVELEPEAVPSDEPASGKLVITYTENSSPKLIAESVIYDGGKKLNSYQREGEDAINMPAGDEYTPRAYGVLTFRNDAFRQNAASGTVGDVELTTLSTKWRTPAGSVRGSGSTTYYGIGWAGQPAIVKWTKEVREISNINAEKCDTSALKEVIIAGEDGRIYFLDLEDGQETREAINLGYPMRSTPSIHPLGFPLMSVGQFARKMASGTGDIGMRIYSLVNQKQLAMIDGLDKSYERPYYSVGSFETSSLIDAASDTMISAGSNGMLYLTKLNSSFEYNANSNTGNMGISPSSIAMKSKVKKESNKYTAIEASIAMYQSYVFFADMAGYLRCVDTDTMETKWAVATGDAVEASIALDMDENGQLWLYTANTLQNRGKGNCQIRCFNAMNGEQAWVIEVNVAKQKKSIAGVMASPVIGQNQLGDYVYFTVSNVSKNGAKTLGMSGAKSGVLICANKTTGEIVWTYELSSYSYSSPVAVYNDAGKGWIVQASNDSRILLLDGATGEMLDVLVLKGKINASPAVYKNTLVIGVQGSKDNAAIYGITLE